MLQFFKYMQSQASDHIASSFFCEILRSFLFPLPFSGSWFHLCLMLDSISFKPDDHFFHLEALPSALRFVHETLPEVQSTLLTL
jgi:hypothetical protein